MNEKEKQKIEEEYDSHRLANQKALERIEEQKHKLEIIGEDIPYFKKKVLDFINESVGGEEEEQNRRELEYFEEDIMQELRVDEQEWERQYQELEEEKKQLYRKEDNEKDRYDEQMKRITQED